jgi:hypothetical protein
MDIFNHGFLPILIQETHFEHGYGLLHIKRNDRWLNTINPWIMNAYGCKNDIKL